MKRIVRSGVMRLILFISLAGLTANAAWADSGNYKNYGRVGLGVNKFNGDLDDSGYDANIAFNASYGRYLGKNIVIEGSVDYFYAHQDISGSTSVAGAYSRDDQIGVGALLATLKGEIPLGPVTLYGGGGIGAYYAALKTEIDTTNLGSFDVEDDDSVFGFHLVAGGYYDITPRLFVGAEGLYRWTGDLDMKKITGTVPVQLKGNLDGYVVTLSAGFRF
jgi:opacity protein-like surface antigen